MDHESKLKLRDMSSVCICHCVNYTKTVTVLSVLCSTFMFNVHRSKVSPALARPALYAYI